MPAIYILDGDVPERPSSTASMHTGFEELFPAVIPPRRPLTPSPDKRGDKHMPHMLGIPHRPTARKSSEAVAIERIFQNFSLPPSPEPILHEKPAPVLDNEAAFKADLANVLVWFESDLANSQRITTAFTLLNHLTTWQLRFVMSLLSKPSENYAAEASDMLHLRQHRSLAQDSLTVAPPSSQESFASEVPPGLEKPPRVESPRYPRAESPRLEPARPYDQSWRRSPGPPSPKATATSPSSPNISVASSEVNSTASEITLEQCNPELFYRDIPAWLRSLRLHKYSTVFSSMTQADLLALVAGETEVADAKLEQLGILALGARRKVMRVLSMIHASRLG